MSAPCWCPPCRELEEGVHAGRRRRGADEQVRGAARRRREGRGPSWSLATRCRPIRRCWCSTPAAWRRAASSTRWSRRPCSPRSEKIAAGGGVLAELEQKVQAAPDDLQALRAGGRVRLAARRARADAEFDRVIAGDPDNAKGLAAKAMSDRAAFLVAKIDGDSEQAVALYKELQAKFPAAKESVQAYRAIGRELRSGATPGRSPTSGRWSRPTRAAATSRARSNGSRSRLQASVGAPEEGSTPRSPGERQPRRAPPREAGAAPARARHRALAAIREAARLEAGVGVLQAPGAALH